LVIKRFDDPRSKSNGNRRRGGAKTRCRKNARRETHAETKEISSPLKVQRKKMKKRGVRVRTEADSPKTREG